MGKRYLGLASLVLALTACGSNGGGEAVSPKPVEQTAAVAAVTSIDDACRGLSASEVGTALGADDIKVLADVPFKDAFTGMPGPGRECAYWNRESQSTAITVDKGAYGLTIMVTEKTKKSWDDGHHAEAGFKTFWEKVEVGDEAYQLKNDSRIHALKGKWVIVVVAQPKQPMTEQEFRSVVLGLMAKFVAQLPRS